MTAKQRLLNFVTLLRAKRKRENMNKFRNNETATAIETAINSNAFLKESLQGSCNVKITDNGNNHVADLFSTSIRDRVEIWLDCNSIVLFIGGNVKETTKTSKDFESLFTESLYANYNNKINASVNTKHKFTSIESATAILRCLSERVVKKESEKKETKQTQKAKTKKTTKKESKTA